MFLGKGPSQQPAQVHAVWGLDTQHVCLDCPGLSRHWGDHTIHVLTQPCAHLCTCAHTCPCHTRYTRRKCWPCVDCCPTAREWLAPRPRCNLATWGPVLLGGHGLWQRLQVTPGTDTACESRFPPFTPYELPLRTAGFGTCLCLPSVCLHSGPGSWAVLGAPQQTKRSSPAVHPHGLLCLAAATCRIPLLPPLCPLSPLTTGMEALVLEGTSVCACAAAGPLGVRV